MLVLMCAIGRERLALPVTHIAEVVPRVELHVPTERPQWLAGHFVYRGRPTPVIEWSNTDDETHRLSDRIVLLSVSIGVREELVGIAVRDSTTQQLNDAEVQHALHDASLRTRWGTILLDERGMFQFVDFPKLISDEMLGELFPHSLTR